MTLGPVTLWWAAEVETNSDCVIPATVSDDCLYLMTPTLTTGDDMMTAVLLLLLMMMMMFSVSSVMKV